MVVNVNLQDECQGAHIILMKCDGGKDIPEHESNGSLEVQRLKRPRTLFNDPSLFQNFACAKVDVVENDALFECDLDIGKGKLETQNPSDESFQAAKSEYSLTLLRRALQKKISLHVGEKLMQFLMDNSLELPKFISSDKCIKERIFDTPTSRSRKYNRSVSFNSRRVGLVFSILSIMGTMILIYLTIRVRLINEASSNL